MPGSEPDGGEIKLPGWLGRMLGQSPTIGRDANLAAAIDCVPADGTIVETDRRGNWLIYQTSEGRVLIRFRAVEAWFPNEPSVLPNDTDGTLATVHTDGRVIVFEGLHRTRAMARQRVVIKTKLGGVERAPGWLDFVFIPGGLQQSPSSIAIERLLGGDPEAPLIPAR